MSKARPWRTLRESLSRRALAICRARGHSMTRVDWRFETNRPFEGGGTITHANGFSTCRQCGEYIVLRTHPKPNEVEESGEPMTCDCRMRRAKA